MNFDDNALIHDRKCFDRDTLAERLEKLKFNSLARMELFLWDLEIFLQIQAILKDKIVLKGGAAAQFYLPIEYQRTIRSPWFGMCEHMAASHSIAGKTLTDFPSLAA